MLLVKLGLVCVALSWGAVHHFVARPALERGDGSILTRLPRSLAGESTIAMAVLLAAAVLVDSKPPPRPAKPTQTLQQTVARSGSPIARPVLRAAR